MDLTSDSEDNEFDWGSEDESPACDPSIFPPAVAGEAGPSRPKLVLDFMGMGFSEELVVKAIKDNGEGDKEAILETLLTYSAIEKLSSVPEHSPIDPGEDDDNDLSLSDDDPSSMDSFGEETKEKISMDTKFPTLVEMGFGTDEVSAAIGRCGPDASILELADSIHAAQTAKEYDDRLDELGFLSGSTSSSSYEDEFRQSHAYDLHKRKRAGSCSFMDKKRAKKNKDIRCQGRTKEQFMKGSGDHGEGFMALPNPMIGFGLPNEPWHVTKRKLPEAAIGPPYFYYENVALAPKGVWDTISRFLYDVEPEFVDSKYFCAAARKRGYIHNLPIHNRFLLQPVPPHTIHEALPLTKKWWPSWDPRTKLNCLQTSIASAKLTESIRRALVDSDDPLPMKVQQNVLKECRKWNLVWVGRHKVAPLEPDEIEALLGFPKNHTRGGGISRTERYRSLGNSFQVDTVAYHLSVLKEMFPNGITLLSLFSGIGGAEVALHRLGIHMKAVVSVEISEFNRNIMRGWWEQTGQTGTLIDIADVQQLTGDRLEQMIHMFGGFDLVIGGSPCNNLAGSNRVSRDGLEGEHSSLFYDYFRILDLVKCTMGKSF